VIQNGDSEKRKELSSAMVNVK